MRGLQSAKTCSETFTLNYTVKPVWNDPLWKDHPAWKDHFPFCENFYLPKDSIKTEPVWNDHLSGNLDRPTSLDIKGGRSRQVSHWNIRPNFTISPHFLVSGIYQGTECDIKVFWHFTTGQVAQRLCLPG